MPHFHICYKVSHVCLEYRQLKNVIVFHMLAQNKLH